MTKKFESIADNDAELDALQNSPSVAFAFGGVKGTMTQEEHDRRKVKSKKVSISLPEDLYDDISIAASMQQMNVSKTIQEAVRRYLDDGKIKEIVAKYKEMQAQISKV